VPPRVTIGPAHETPQLYKALVYWDGVVKLYNGIEPRFLGNQEKRVPTVR